MNVSDSAAFMIFAGLVAIAYAVGNARFVIKLPEKVTFDLPREVIINQTTNFKQEPGKGE